jgi:hypothetical protein
MTKSISIARPQIARSGPKCLSGGSVIPAMRREPEHEDLARVAQVGGQEDHDGDLRQLRGLHGQRADPDGQVRAVRRRERPRQHEQEDPGERDRVAEALELAVVAEHDDHGGEGEQADDEPLRLLAGQLVVDPVDHHEPEAREQGHEREEVGVGVLEPRRSSRCATKHSPRKTPP